MLTVRIKDARSDYWHWFLLAGRWCIPRCYAFWPLAVSQNSIEEIDPLVAKKILGAQAYNAAEERISRGITMFYRGTSTFDPADFIVPAERYL